MLEFLRSLRLLPIAAVVFVAVAVIVAFVTASAFTPIILIGGAITLVLLDRNDDLL